MTFTLAKMGNRDYRLWVRPGSDFGDVVLWVGRLWLAFSWKGRP